MEREKDFYLLPDAALLLKVGVRTLRTWIKEGKLKAVKRGRAYYVLYDDILEFLKPPSNSL